MQTAYYIASGFGNVEPVRKLKKILDDAGWSHTYDWTSQQGTTLAETAKLEVSAALAAHVVIVLLPGGRGTHVELGVFLGSTLLAMAIIAAGVDAEMDERRVLVYSPDPEKDFEADTSVFYHHPLVEKHTSMRDMINSLLGRHPSADDLWKE